MVYEHLADVHGLLTHQSKIWAQMIVEADGIQISTTHPLSFFSPELHLILQGQTNSYQGEQYNQILLFVHLISSKLYSSYAFTSHCPPQTAARRGRARNWKVRPFRNLLASLARQTMPARQSM